MTGIYAFITLLTVDIVLLVAKVPDALTSQQ